MRESTFHIFQIPIVNNSVVISTPVGNAFKANCFVRLNHCRHLCGSVYVSALPIWTNQCCMPVISGYVMRQSKFISSAWQLIEISNTKISNSKKSSVDLAGTSVLIGRKLKFALHVSEKWQLGFDVLKYSYGCVYELANVSNHAHLGLVIYKYRRPIFSCSYAMV